MQTPRPQQINADAFMSLSKIAFSSLERLVTLNMNATRAAFDNSFATSSALLDVKDEKGQKNVIDKLPAAASNGAIDYFKGVQQIAAETQKEVADLMASYFGPLGDGANPNAAWMKGFELFKSFGNQITAMTESNAKAVGDATAQAASSMTQHSKKTA